MPFTVYTSNRLEVLAEELARCVSRPLSSPLTPEIIVVQSRGMERWVSLQLAQKLGVCANVRFPFPNAFVDEIFAATGLKAAAPEAGEAEPANPYDPPVLTWRLMKQLPECLQETPFEPLRRYLREPGSTLKRLQLCLRLADLFDQYQVYRPEMVFAWEQGQEEHWQARLWRKLVQEQPEPHRAGLGRKLLESLRGARAGTFNLPERVSVFGISTLPEFHLSLLDALARHTEVHLFFMSPCREYWGDLRTKKERLRGGPAQLSLDFAADEPEAALEGDNALLASLGKLGRDFFYLIEDFDYEPRWHFEEPGEDRLLHTLQTDLLNLVQSPPGRKRPVAPNDRSVQFHACHSPRREVEVLHDHLLAWFEADPSLTPADVLVMAPDIEPYAPYIQAVFDRPADDPRRIPYSIADRSYGRENEVVETFLALLELSHSRFGAGEVLAILEAPSVRARFNLTESDLELIQHWVRETRIRWARDAEDRARLGLPDYPQNTWQAGLQRLLLGYALPGEGERRFAEILPYDHVEGSQGEVLGNFLEFTDRLFEKMERLRAKHTLEAWYEELDGLLQTFFESDDATTPQLEVVRRALLELAQMPARTGFHEELELRVLQYLLERKFHAEGYGYGFLTGGVTFCSMLPMRSIPARKICLLGMNYDAYPRPDYRLGFDLIAQKPRRGDRSRRNDDRYLFLEALLSARETLYVSYVGQNIQDNSVVPPSVVVSDLLEYLEAQFALEGAGDAQTSLLAHLRTEHRLQAFHPAYFQADARLFSYSSENLAAARALGAPRQELPAFLHGLTLPEAEPDFRTVSLHDLWRFFRNPVRFLLERRLNLFLPKEGEELPDTEAFALQHLDRYRVAERLLERGMAGEPTEEVRAAALAAGELPHGRFGETEFETLAAQVSGFVEKTRAQADVRKVGQLAVELELDGFRLTGKIEGITDSGLLFYRYARVQARDHLQAWLHHLAWHSVAGTSASRTLLFGVDNLSSGAWVGWQYTPVPDPRRLLADLLALYWQGLHQPLRFFPQAGLEFAESLLVKGDERAAVKKAVAVWRGREDGHGEQDDPYFKRCFGREEEPLNQAFQALARQVYEPLLQARQELGR